MYWTIYTWLWLHVYVGIICLNHMHAQIEKNNYNTHTITCKCLNLSDPQLICFVLHVSLFILHPGVCCYHFNMSRETISSHIILLQVYLPGRVIFEIPNCDRSRKETYVIYYPIRTMPAACTVTEYPRM